MQAVEGDAVFRTCARMTLPGDTSHSSYLSAEADVRMWRGSGIPETAGTQNRQFLPHHGWVAAIQQVAHAHARHACSFRTGGEFFTGPEQLAIACQVSIAVGCRRLRRTDAQENRHPATFIS